MAIAWHLAVRVSSVPVPTAKLSQFFSIHPDDPQLRLIRQAVAIIRDGGVAVLPTDSCYALGCHIGDKAAMERIRAIRGGMESPAIPLASGPALNFGSASAIAVQSSTRRRSIA